MSIESPRDEFPKAFWWTKKNVPGPYGSRPCCWCAQKYWGQRKEMTTIMTMVTVFCGSLPGAKHLFSSCAYANVIACSVDGQHWGFCIIMSWSLQILSNVVLTVLMFCIIQFALNGVSDRTFFAWGAKAYFWTSNTGKSAYFSGLCLLLVRWKHWDLADRDMHLDIFGVSDW